MLVVLVVAVAIPLSISLTRDRGGELPQVGDTPPSFTLPRAGGGDIELDQVVASNQATILVFYRGFF